MMCGLKRLHGHADVASVIELHRLHGNGTFFVNPDLIELVEARPDTTITLVNKHRYVVEDAVDAVVERIVEFRARIAAAGTSPDHAAGVRAFNVIETDDQERAA